MDRENNDRSMIDRTVGEKKEFNFPAVHFPVMAWASLVCFACFALYLLMSTLRGQGRAARNVWSTTAQSRKRVACGVWTRKNRGIHEKRIAAPSKFWTSTMWTRKSNLYFAGAVSPFLSEQKMGRGTCAASVIRAAPRRGIRLRKSINCLSRPWLYLLY